MVLQKILSKVFVENRIAGYLEMNKTHHLKMVKFKDMFTITS